MFQINYIFLNYFISNIGMDEARTVTPVENEVNSATILCEPCKGTGLCYKCQGEGKIIMQKIGINAPIYYTLCPWCKGRKQCSYCNGYKQTTAEMNAAFHRRIRNTYLTRKFCAILLLVIGVTLFIVGIPLLLFYLLGIFFMILGCFCICFAFCYDEKTTMQPASNNQPENIMYSSN